jgi:anti-sigma factor RsiW
LASCKNIPKISAYYDGELSPGEARALAQHIRQCPPCWRELQRLRALSNWLSSVPVPEIPAAALDRLRHSVQPRRDRAVLRMAKALTAAAAAVLIVCSVLLWQGLDARAAPVQTPAEWERAAVMPPSLEPTALDSGAEDDVDVQLARSILGSLSTEEASGYE